MWYFFIDRGIIEFVTESERNVFKVSDPTGYRCVTCQRKTNRYRLMMCFDVLVLSKTHISADISLPITVLSRKLSFYLRSRNS